MGLVVADEGESGGDTDAGDSTELSVNEASKRKKSDRKKKKPGKLPKDFQKTMTDNSKEAADNALKRFFSGR